MKTHQYTYQKTRTMTNPYYAIRKILCISFMMFIISNIMMFDAKAEEGANEITYSDAKWYFGLSGAANLNFYEGTTHRLTDDLLLPTTFHEGFGLKPYGAGLIEYRFDHMWGIKLNFGYDGRGGKFDEVLAPCDLVSELETNLSYLVLEPSIRFAPFRSGFHLFAGPRFSINFQNEFLYRREIQHTSPVEFLEEEDEWSELNDNLLSLQIGAGYDFMLSSPSNRTKYVLTPFVSFHPYFGQVPRNIETWSITTVRAGISIKIGRGIPVPVPDIVIEPEPVVEEIEVVEPEITEPPVVFSVRPPVLERRSITNKVYPIRNIVFFDKESVAIPNRYTLLTIAEARRFSEDDLKQEITTLRRQDSENQMIIYYNILNVLGERMRVNPNTSITLSGFSAGSGADVGRRQAESIKDYLVSVFNIEPARITATGADWPTHRSFRHGEQAYADLRLDSDRRVEIISSNPELMLTVDGQPSGVFQPVVTSVSDEGRLDNHIVLSLTNAERHMEEWFVELTDPQGVTMEFGPFTRSQESVAGNEVLAKGSEGLYKIVMRGVSKEGLEFSRETTFELHDREIDELNVIRYSMLYDFDLFEASPAYKQYLANNFAPLIRDNSKVIIHGHSDLIGDPDYNRALSLQRARNAKSLIESVLDANNIRGVEFEVYGFGELTDEAPFPNRYPEQRFYNRTVIIDIIP